MIMNTSTTIRCDLATRDRCTVVRLLGQLTPTTYLSVRDALIKLALDEPRAVVADIRDLFVSSAPALTVFSAAWMRVNDWPGVPIVLVADPVTQGRLVRDSSIGRFLPVHATVDGAIADVDLPPDRRWTQLELPPVVASSADARRYVTDTVVRWGVPEATADAVAVATELVENAVRHAGTDLRLRLELRRGMLTIAVSDDSRAEAVLREPSAGRPARNGLHIVSSVATKWGCTPDPSGGKVVWAVLLTAQRPFQALLS